MSLSMKCPTCGEMESETLDTRPAHKGFSIRRRQCKNGHRFKTRETYAPWHLPELQRGLAKK